MQSIKSLLSILILSPVVVFAGSVDINSADAKTLSKELKGVGPARAEAIVRYRTQHGPFKSVDELAMVKNIPQKVIDANRADIRTEAGGGVAKVRTAGPAHAPAAPRPVPARPH